MKKILLIEDDSFLNQLYTDLLTKEKYDVTSIVDGNEALKQILEHEWDLILLDVMLPGMNGFDIYKEVEAKKKKLKSPIIFMTNLDSSDDDKKSLKQATDYWIKSNMTPPEFIEKVKKTLK